METNYETVGKTPSALARERVVADIIALTHDAEELLKATASDASDKAREARARISATLERAKASYANFQDHTLSAAKDAAKKADTVIREHPYESIGIAFGIGLLLGVVVSRK